MKMKKLITVLCVVAIAASFASCSNNTSGGKKAEQSTTVSTTVAKTEKTADAVAKALNFHDKETKWFETINASDGAGYTTPKGNHAEIYIFTDEKAEDHTSGWDDDGCVTINNNVMLYLEGKADTDENKEIIKEFKSLNF